MSHMSIRRFTAMAVLCLSPVLAGTPAHATPGEWIDPGTEGSLVYTGNAGAVLASDLSSSPGVVAAGCLSTATDPATRANTLSPTGQEIFSIVTLTSLSAGACSDSWRIERWRTGLWRPLHPPVSNTIAGVGSQVRGEVGTACRAGTWPYRVRANSYHTASVSFTCANTSGDLFYIDQT